MHGEELLRRVMRGVHYGRVYRREPETAVGMHGEETITRRTPTSIEAARGRTMKGETIRFYTVWRKVTPDETRTRGGENIRSFRRLKPGEMSDAQITVYDRRKQAEYEAFTEYAKTHDYPNQLHWLYMHTSDPVQKARYKAMAENYYVERNWWESLSPTEQLEFGMLQNPKLRTEENMKALTDYYASSNFYMSIGYPELGGKYAAFVIPEGQAIQQVAERPRLGYTATGEHLPPTLEVTFKASGKEEPMAWVPTSLFGPKISRYNAETGALEEKIAPDVWIKTVPSLTGGPSPHETLALGGMTLIEGMIAAGMVAKMTLGAIDRKLFSGELGFQFRQHAPESLLKLRYGEQAKDILIEREWGWGDEALGFVGGKPAMTEFVSKESFLTGESLSRSAETVQKVEPWFTVTRGTPQTPMSVTLGRATSGTMLSDYLGGYPEVVLKQPPERLPFAYERFMPSYPVEEVAETSLARFMFPLVSVAAFPSIRGSQQEAVVRKAVQFLGVRPELMRPQRASERSRMLLFSLLSLKVSLGQQSVLGQRSDISAREVTSQILGVSLVPMSRSSMVLAVPQKPVAIQRAVAKSNEMLPPSRRLPAFPEERKAHKRKGLKGKEFIGSYLRIFPIPTPEMLLFGERRKRR